MGMGGTCVLHENFKEKAPLSSLGGLLLVGSVTYMQYNTHGLYFMKRNNALIRV